MLCQFLGHPVSYSAFRPNQFRFGSYNRNAIPLWLQYRLYIEQYEQLRRCCYCVEPDWSASGNAGDNSHESVSYALWEWFWRRWRLPAHARQVQQFRATSFHCASLNLRGMSLHFDWMAAVNYAKVASPSAEKADSTLVCIFVCILMTDGLRRFSIIYVII